MEGGLKLENVRNLGKPWLWVCWTGSFRLKKKGKAGISFKGFIRCPDLPGAAGVGLVGCVLSGCGEIGLSDLWHYEKVATWSPCSGLQIKEPFRYHCSPSQIWVERFRCRWFPMWDYPMSCTFLWQEEPFFPMRVSSVLHLLLLNLHHPFYVSSIAYGSTTASIFRKGLWKWCDISAYRHGNGCPWWGIPAQPTYCTIP